MATPQGFFYEQLGRKIREARIAANITQAELARSVQLSRTSVTNIEKGRQPVPVHLLVEMSQVLGIQLSQLIPNNAAQSPTGMLPEMEHLGAGAQDWIRRILNPSSEKT